MESHEERSKSKMDAPERGDIVMVDFNETSGHEQAGYRPALVLSPAAYNRKTGLAMMCAITTHVKNSAFEVTLPEFGKITGVVLANHLRSFDWFERDLKKVDHAPDHIVIEVQEILKELLF
jgi:mRNA interferase MazF